MIRIKCVSHIFNGKAKKTVALKNINLSIEECEFISIVGKSGCGKTTLLKIIGGLLKPSRGQVMLYGKEPSELLKEKEIAFIFQNPILMRWRTSQQNIALPLEMGNPMVNKEKKILELLDLMGLQHFRNSYPDELSGGMQTRVAIARALITQPSILLMDEPFGNLDEITKERLMLMVDGLWCNIKTKLTNAVLVTHNITEAILLSDRVVVLSKNPTEVKSIIHVPFKRPRNLDIVESKEFLNIKSRIRMLL